MKIDSLTLHSTNGWPALGTDALSPGLNVFHGGSASGKTTLADLATHAIYGRRFARIATAEADHPAPDGEVVVQNRGKQFRLRRSHDEAAGERLTVAALDQSAVDQETVRHLVASLSPALLQPLFAVSFREPPEIDWLLSQEFSQEFRDTMWRLKWAPPTVNGALRPLYARLRALETQVATLVRGMASAESRAATDAKVRLRARKRRASYFLDRLTGGELVRLHVSNKVGARVVTSRGDSLPVESLWSTQRDQVYLSLCLALVSALGRHGARLPLILDEPFTRLDARASAALVKTLSRYAGRGNQVLVFTAQREAAGRSATLGANVMTIESLRGRQIVPTESNETEVIPRRIRRRVKTVHRKRREAG